MQNHQCVHIYSNDFCMSSEFLLCPINFKIIEAIFSPISASSPGQHITLNFTFVDTECSYDHIYVYDGNTYESRKLGVFSGDSIPGPITATSGHMLILLYSDTNYALKGFTAEYSITGNIILNKYLSQNHSCSGRSIP